ncbi:hypothetical protein, partial [Sporohalobacter salinus]|uniref:hypothetical protein n=1 Tax=Sporohalobacter salinus TaxID=1494606 RepID=UPI00196205C5
MVDSIKISSENTHDFDQQAANINDKISDSQQLSKEKERKQQENESYFKEKKSGANWNGKSSLYNSKGAKTNNISNVSNSKTFNLKMEVPVSGQAIISSDYGE